MNRLESAIEGLKAARRYTLGLLEQTKSDDWFKLPNGVSHIGWQVGHIASAQFWLALVRIRGKRPSDDDLLPPGFAQMFGRSSTPAVDAGQYPNPDQLRAILERIHLQALSELATVTDDELDAPTDQPPHPIAKTKLQCILWCGNHEMVHAGQIGLIRRELGYPPIW